MKNYEGSVGSFSCHCEGRSPEAISRQIEREGSGLCLKSLSLGKIASPSLRSGSQ